MILFLSKSWNFRRVLASRLLDTNRRTQDVDVLKSFNSCGI